ncbi:hydantoinase B/oxoprolinase family protein [Agrobacterium vitis]|uniref:Hydantoinase B/oxoprolinase family protein n=1 Tax=Agrobacterium vitis TaxID=373 RepID=A0AAE5AXA3_AGRVI|nr:hydantoinase B/oxoprolinase family protein [Agrobacterium vitis]MCF1500165.1 hydantoinase B/oxoprolinase family protein [Allorhizobium sp. Av2]MCM2441773.1 hydantoinase B/oxoprolinase family protein [Agrobacterium vitis]MUZ59020.1 hydantoinase B/oxoprolinase family protein [Agrobacterium vitis]MVA68626.1 hydantoinase B/oxoprolinase family protein [Agrobacterium vitis]MVA88612.1 hydantoinase B/oxoprolinase family protein [Agrobacterium vitis]
MMAGRHPFDPVTQEIIEGKLIATVDEMGIVMARTSMSPVIYEVLDFACGVLTAKGELIAQMNGITLFTGTFGRQVKALIDRFGTDMADGDILLTNDPYAGGTHACDFAIVKPIFVDDVLLAFAINVAHYLDVGGSVPGSLSPAATSVYQEGLRLPGVKIVRNDMLSSDILHIISENVRMPEIALGDLTAQIATVRVAARRMNEFTAKYGAPTLIAAFDHILNVSERQSRQAIAALPDGVYRASDIIDGDGVTTDPIAVQVAVTIAGDQITADFTGCPPAVAGPINCARGALESAVRTILKALVAPQSPSNEGWFRPLNVIAPSGTVFTAEKPSPTGWYYEGSVHASELVWKALAALVPERFSAGSYSSLCVAYISGNDRSGRPFIHIEPQHGGWGAGVNRDGANALISLTDGDTYNYSVEVIEARFPLLVRRYGLNIEGGSGAGRMRGGFGIIREYEILGDKASAYCSFGRTRTLPWGMDGGHDGTPNSLQVLAASGENACYGRSADIALKTGDVVRIVTGGGGGWGDPGDRDPALVETDLKNGFVSAEAATSLYGYRGRIEE